MPFSMPKNRAVRAALAAAGILLGLLLLPTLLPFLIGFLLAAAGRALGKRLLPRLPQSAAACVCVSALLLLSAGAAYLLIRQLIDAAGHLSADLPAMLSSLAAPAAAMQKKLAAFSEKLPDGFRQAMSAWSASLFSGSSTLVDTLSGRLLSFASGLISGLPDAVLFLVTTILSAYFFACAMPRFQQSLARILPERWTAWITSLKELLRGTLGGWLRAQLCLMGVTFGIVTLGLLILGIRYALLFGIAIALIDALPVLGVGAVLGPWGLIAFLRGEVRRGVGLLVLWAVASLTRSALEPRILGKQLGLPPLLTLFAMYAGFKLFGIAGMIFLPVGAILARQILALSNGQKTAIIEKTPERRRMS